MEQPLIQQEIFPWVLGLVIGLPVLIILLGELAERLQARQNPLAEAVKQVRHVALPLILLLHQDYLLRYGFGKRPAVSSMTELRANVSNNGYAGYGGYDEYE